MLQATLYTTVQPELARSIIKIAYLDIANFKPKNEVYRTFFSEPLPARICCGGQLASLGMLVEIDAVAYGGT